ncbi:MULTISPECIES: hypothetical protein [Sphingomonas]|uniref:Preprotein translocase subunit YajC n=1 Tax=Edaphosphingomonas fennica TaxID=114404 RepID=A0A2T4I656_9SPHN|nr:MULTISPECIES: hypothetical protein [Sphingomonas]MDX3883424.1 hypothetical protein [Sphingomonas sp.]PTD26118.1 hypothetical protein CV103_03665 [Sphingomonas fennica]
MSLKGSRRRRPAAIHIAAAGLAVTVPLAAARAEITGKVDVSASAGYASNPFLNDVGDKDSGFVEGAIRPSLAITGARGRTDITTYYRRTEYFRRYNDSNAYGGSVRATRQLSEKIDARALLSFDSSIVGADDPDGDLVDPELPENPDIGLIGARQRRHMLNGSAGLTYRPNARDSWSADFRATKSDYPDNSRLPIEVGQDYVSYGGTLGYSHAISETSSLGASVTYTEVDYEAAGRDSRIISPQLTYSRRFGGGWTLAAGAGVSFTQRKLLTGNDNSTAFTGNIEVCREGSRGNLCIGGSRSTTATGFGGVRNETEGHLTHSYKLSERSSLSSRISYSRNGNAALPTSGSRDYLTVSTLYSRSLNERLRVTAYVGYRDIYRSTVSPPADISGRLGLAYTLGDRR